MRIKKYFLVSALLLIASWRSFAVTMPEFEIDLERGDNSECIKKLCSKRFEIGVGAWVIQEMFRAHMWSVVQKDHSDVVDPGSIKYFDSVYKIIPTEIARCFLRIRGGAANYKDVDPKEDDIVYCFTEGCKECFRQYTQENWNYFMLVNVLYQCLRSTETHEDVVEYTYKKLLRSHDQFDGKDIYYDREYCNFALYEKELKKARNDIQEYFAKLQLFDFIKIFVHKVYNANAYEKNKSIVDDLVEDACELERLQEAVKSSEYRTNSIKETIKHINANQQKIAQTDDEKVKRNAKFKRYKEAAKAKCEEHEELKSKYKSWDTIADCRYNIDIYLKYIIDYHNKNIDTLKEQIDETKKRMQYYSTTDGALANQKQLDKIIRFGKGLADNNKSKIDELGYETTLPKNETIELPEYEIYEFIIAGIEYKMTTPNKEFKDISLSISRATQIEAPAGARSKTSSNILRKEWLTKCLQDAVKWEANQNDEILKKINTVSEEIRTLKNQSEHEKVMMRLIDINNRLPLMKLPLLGMPYGDMHYEDKTHTSCKSELADMAKYYGKRDNKEYKDLNDAKTITYLLRECYKDIESEYKFKIKGGLDELIKKAEGYTPETSDQILHIICTVCTKLCKKNEKTKHEQAMIEYEELRAEAELIKDNLYRKWCAEREANPDEGMPCESKLTYIAEYYGERDNKEYTDLRDEKTLSYLFHECYEDIKKEYDKIK